VGYTISQIAGPAFAPTIATALFAAYGTSDAVVAYLLVVAAISIVCVALLPGGWGRREAAFNAASLDAADGGEPASSPAGVR
jgi:hypothetical protein